MWLPPNCIIVSENKSLRALAIAFWSLLGSVLFIIVSLALPLGPGWRQILWGALIVIAGSAGSQLLPEWKKRKWLRWVRAVCIGIVVAMGALTTTYGWNERDNYLRDRAMFVAMATELDLNQIRIELLSLAHQEYQTTGKPEAMTALPLPSNRQVSQVLSFSDILRDDLKLAGIIFEYVIAADLLSSKIEQIDRVCSNYIVSRKMRDKIVQSAFGEKRIFDTFHDIHKRLAGHIVAHYDWCFDEAGDRIRKSSLDSFYLAIVKKQMQLNEINWQKRMKQLRDSLKQQGVLIPIPNDDLNSRNGQDPND